MHITDTITDLLQILSAVQFIIMTALHLVKSPSYFAFCHHLHELVGRSKPYFLLYEK